MSVCVKVCVKCVSSSDEPFNKSETVTTLLAYLPTVTSIYTCILTCSEFHFHICTTVEDLRPRWADGWDGKEGPPISPRALSPSLPLALFRYPYLSLSISLSIYLSISSLARSLAMCVCARPSS
jgi:hypothetical protein